MSAQDHQEAQHDPFGPEEHPHGPDAPHGSHPDEEAFDQEIDIKGALWTGAGLVATIVVSMLLMWPLSCAMKNQLIAADRAPSPIAEVSERRLPPGPNLQPSPEAELIEMRAEEKTKVDGYGWVDQRTGVAHIPVARAIEILAQRGLPKTAPAPVPPAPAAPAPGAE